MFYFSIFIENIVDKGISNKEINNNKGIDNKEINNNKGIDNKKISNIINKIFLKK